MQIVPCDLTTSCNLTRRETATPKYKHTKHSRRLSNERANFANFTIERENYNQLRHALPIDSEPHNLLRNVVTMAASIIPKSLLPTTAAASSTATRRALLTPLLRQSLRPATKTTTIVPPLPLSSRRSLHQTSQRQNQTPSKPATTPSLPDFSLANRVIIVSGGARGLGLTQAQALLEAGAASVHALDRLPHPPADSDFVRVAASSATSAGGSPRLHYHRVDVRDQSALAKIVGGIAEKEGRIDGLIAAAGIQQETPALEYSAEDVDKMMGVNVTGVFMTAQAVAREMIKRKQKGSMVLVGSMSGTVANRGLICP